MFVSRAIDFANVAVKDLTFVIPACKHLDSHMLLLREPAQQNVRMALSCRPLLSHVRRVKGAAPLVIQQLSA
jgi:hypothetical protein